MTSSLKIQEPNQALVSGLHSQDRYFKHHAYLELSALAASLPATSVARRTALFTDSRTTPTLWNALSRELLVTLGKDYQLLLRRGKPALSPTAAAKPAPLVTKTPQTPTTPLLRRQILKLSPPALSDKLASDVPAIQTPSPTASSADYADLPNIFLLSTPSTPFTKKNEVDTVKEAKSGPVPQLMQRMKVGGKSAVKDMLCWIERKLPGDWRVRDLWTNVNLVNVARSCLPESEMDVTGIDAISHLIAASLVEDTMGTVQRDIPRILEALLSFLSEAEAFKAELESKLPTETTEDGSISHVRALDAAKEVASAVDVVQPVVVALRAGIGLIAKTFGDGLGVYKFPPSTAKRLQTFMDCL